MPIDFEIQQGLPFLFTNLPNLVKTAVLSKQVGDFFKFCGLLIRPKL